MCVIEDCPADPVAKGLCAKHYMRLRRQGDPNKTAKRGPKQADDPTRGKFPGWSARRYADFRQAWKLLQYNDVEGTQRIFAEASRPNGDINITKLRRLAWKRYFEIFPDAGLN
jgi:hypothetical protein